MTLLADTPPVFPSFRSGLPERYRLMWVTIALCAVAVPVTILALAIDPRMLDHEAIWLKPLKFDLSMLLHGATVLAAASTLPQRLAEIRTIRWAIWATAAAMLYELAFLNIQAARGVASHFNDATAFDAIGGTIMAAGAGVLVTGPAIVGFVLLWSQRRAEDRSPLRVAFGLGLILGGVFAAVSGSAIGANGGPFVGAYDPADPVWPLFGWSMTIGDLRIGHFFGLHIMQALPLAVWLAGQVSTRAVTWGVILPVATIGSGLSMVATARALEGVPLF